MKKAIGIFGLVIFLSASSWAQKKTTFGIELGIGARPSQANFSELMKSDYQNFSANIFLERQMAIPNLIFSTGLNFAQRNFHESDEINTANVQYRYVQLPIQVFYGFKNGLRLGGGVYAAMLNPMSKTYEYSGDKKFDNGLSFQAIMPFSSRFRVSLQSQFGLKAHQKEMIIGCDWPTQPHSDATDFSFTNYSRYVGLHLGYRLY